MPELEVTEEIKKLLKGMEDVGTEEEVRTDLNSKREHHHTKALCFDGQVFKSLRQVMPESWESPLNENGASVFDHLTNKSRVCYSLSHHLVLYH
jgi:hypothetical protein